MNRLTAGMLTVSLLTGVAAAAQVLDRSIATVNAEPIMLSEYEKNATPILEEFKKAVPPAQQTPERVADIKKRVLDQMIDDRLLVQEAKRKQIKVSQIQVDDGVKKVRVRFSKPDGSIDEAAFTAELKKEGLTNDDFRKRIQDQLMTIKLIEDEVKGKVTPPTDTEVKSLYDTIDAIIKDKPIPGGLTASELEELKALSKAVERRFSERWRASHVLVRVAPTAPKSEKDAAMAKIKDVQARIKKGEEFGELARKFSDDPGSKERGGDLGFFSPGDMVPPFEKAVSTLNVGQTSDIVTTDFGYHIIQLREKKADSKMALDDMKDDLREYLFQQRGAKRFETYVKELRTKSDVKINNFN